MYKVKLYIEGKADGEKIANIELFGDYETYKNVIATKWGVLTILMYEVFFFRIRSDLSVTIISDERERGTTVEVIAAGGHGLGAEKSAIVEVAKRFKAAGFSEI